MNAKIAKPAKKNSLRAWRALRSLATAGAAALVLSASPALAQSASSPATEPGRVELGIGAVWSGRASLGARDANETTGTGGALRLFASSTELARGSGPRGHLRRR